MLVVLTAIQCGRTMKELCVRLHQGSDAVLCPLKYDYSKSSYVEPIRFWDLVAVTHGDAFGFIKMHLPVMTL